MKRRLFKLVVFLILGAVVNVAVCWVIAARPVDPGLSGLFEDGYSPLDGGGFWKLFQSKSLGRVRLRSWWAFEWSGSLNFYPDLPPAHQFVPDWARNIEYLQPAEINDAVVVAEATGWPLLAMIAHYERGVYTQDASGNWHSPFLAPHGILISATSERDGRILPLHPIWPGFAINTIFYAVVLLFITLGPFTARRFIRRKRGQCIKCGYDLRGAEHEVCPECGQELSARTQT